jgi:sigma-B regulation protein RsbU (phosphoserine phosphatase)
MNSTYLDEAKDEKVIETYARKKVASIEQNSEMAEQLARMAQHIFNACGSSVLLVDESSGNLTFKVAVGKIGKHLKGLHTTAQHSIAGWVVCHGEPIIVNNASEDWRFDKMFDTITGFITRSLMCAPIVHNGKIVGIIEVVNKLDGTDFSENDLKALASMARAST